MTIRKRRNPTPDFKLPPPYNPITAGFAQLGVDQYTTRLAALQVCEEDTHDDYVVCRGFDPSDGSFYDGVHGSIAVAKPYARRGKKDYQLAEILVCAKIIGRLGDNPGKAESSDGQPASLSETIVMLNDDEGHPVWWQDVGSGAAYVYAVQMRQTITAATSPQEGDLYTDKEGTNLNKVVDVYAPLLGTESLAAGCWGYVMLNSKGKWLLISAECGCT